MLFNIQKVLTNSASILEQSETDFSIKIILKNEIRK